MGTNILVALIGVAGALLVYALQARKKAKDDAREHENQQEAKKRKDNDTLIDRMCIMREASRRQLANFQVTYEKATGPQGGLTRAEVRAVCDAVRNTISVHADVAIAVGLVYPDVRDAWLHFDEVAAQYMEEIEACVHDENSQCPDDLHAVLDELKAARRDLMVAMKAAAADMGRPLLAQNANSSDLNTP